MSSTDDPTQPLPAADPGAAGVPTERMPAADVPAASGIPEPTTEPIIAPHVPVADVSTAEAGTFAEPVPERTRGSAARRVVIVGVIAVAAAIIAVLALSSLQRGVVPTPTDTSAPPVAPSPTVTTPEAPESEDPEPAPAPVEPAPVDPAPVPSTPTEPTPPPETPPPDPTAEPAE